MMKVPSLLIASPKTAFRVDLFKAFLEHSVRYEVSMLHDQYAATKALVLKTLQFDLVVLDLREAWDPSGYRLSNLLKNNPLGETRFVIITHYEEYPEIEESDRVIRHFTRKDDVPPEEVIRSLSDYEKDILKEAEERLNSSLVSSLA